MTDEVRGDKRRPKEVRGGQRWSEDVREDKRKTSAQEETRKYNFPSFWEIMTDIPTAYPIN